MLTTEHPHGLECPFCHKRLDASTLIGKDGAPKAGHVTICMDCGEVSIYQGEDDRLSLRRPTDEEYTHIGESEEIARVRKVWVEALEARKRQAEKKINVFAPFCDEFEVARAEMVEDDADVEILIACRMFFYSGALAACLRTTKLKGSYADFMLAQQAFIAELRKELTKARDDGVRTFGEAD